MRFCFEYVSKALTADDVAGVRTEFLAEPGDMDINSAVGDNDALPNVIHELLTGQNLATILEEQTKQAEFGAGEAGRLAVDGDGLAIKAYLQTVELEEAFAETGLNDIHNVVAQFLTFGNDVVIDRADGIRVFVMTGFADTLGFELVTQGIDVVFNFLRGVDGQVFTPSADNNHHLCHGLVDQPHHLVQVNVLPGGEVLAAFLAVVDAAGNIVAGITVRLEF